MSRYSPRRVRGLFEAETRRCFSMVVWVAGADAKPESGPARAARTAMACWRHDDGVARHVWGTMGRAHEDAAGLGGPAAAKVAMGSAPPAPPMVIHTAGDAPRPSALLDARDGEGRLWGSCTTIPIMVGLLSGLRQVQGERILGGRPRWSAPYGSRWWAGAGDHEGRPYEPPNLTPLDSPAFAGAGSASAGMRRWGTEPFDRLRAKRIGLGLHQWHAVVGADLV